MIRNHRILIATDLSIESDEHVRRGFELAQDPQKEVVLLYSYAFPGRSDPTDFLGRTSLAIHEQAMLDLARQASRCGGHAPPPRLLARRGAASATILDAARELEVGMIVMGAHRSHGVEQWLVGSVAEHVACEAGCPVLIFPSQAPATHSTIPARRK